MSKKNLLFTLLLLLGTFYIPVKGQDPCIQRKWKTPYTASWIANDGGTQATHVQHWMEYLTVRPDGTVATVAGWDEGGSNVTIFKDGQIIGIPTGSGTGGWGRNSMDGVAMDDQYLYHLQSQSGCDGATNTLNANKLPQYPGCGDSLTWRTVRRYKLNGQPAPFSKGYGYMGDMLVVNSSAANLTGIAIYKNEIFVADAKNDSVKVYDKTTMASLPLRNFHFTDGIGQLSADNKGCIWMLQNSLKKIIRFSITNGTIQSQEIAFPAEVEPSTFFVDTIQNRILVADNGINQNIRIYTDIYNSPICTSFFGAQNGILSGVAGKYEPLKLFDIKGVGADAAGNIYVANSTPGGGAILQAYQADGTLLWDKKSMVFTATACANPDNVQEVYTFDKKMHLDYSKTTPGSEWSFDAYTLNRFKYPDDARLHGAFMTSAWVKNIKGQKFLFTTDMYAGLLAGYRFSPSTDGEIAIPCLLANIAGWDVKSTYPDSLGTEKDFIWMDLNGDGQIQKDEFTYKDKFDNPFSMAMSVDTAGNIWKGIRGQGVRLIPLKEINANGVPVYDYADSKLLDIANDTLGADGVKRLVYDRATDQLFVSGFSKAKPDRKSTGEGVDTWWCMGSTLCMYKNVYDTLSKNPSVNFKTIAPEWRIFLPFVPEGDAAGVSDDDAKSFTVEGDYIFIALAKQGKINVYKRNNGEYTGQIKPLTESGWTDIDYSINVSKTPNEYLIFNEENAFAKVNLYRVSSFETIDSLFPDLIATRLDLMNSNNQVVKQPHAGDVLHFRVTVKNIGPGKTVDGSKISDHVSIGAKFHVKNLTTAKNTLFVSDTCSSSLKSGDSIQLVNYSTNISYPFTWTPEKAKYQITVIPNEVRRITECHTDNNSYAIVFNTYDAAHIQTNPQNTTVSINKNVQFTTEALGDAPLTYKWLVNGIEQKGVNDSVLNLENVQMNLNKASIKVIVYNSLGSDTSAEAILTVDNPFGFDRPGYLLREVWYNVPGTSVVDLKNDPRFPSTPDSITFVKTFEVPTNIADNYGTKVSGWLIPPLTGNYIFFIASDDNGQLFLSTDSLPENLSSDTVASVPDWSDPRVYTKFPQQKSDSIYLDASKKYYVEASFKEGAGGDNLSVAWKLPNGKTETPIPSTRIAFYTGTPGPSSVNNMEKGKASEFLSIYPVPAKDILYIKNPGIDGSAKITITDISGRALIVNQQEVHSSNVIYQEISNLQSGIYFVSVSCKGKSFQAKLIVK
jgi:hypothetical protein